jgi:hypothetical protein
MNFSLAENDTGKLVGNATDGGRNDELFKNVHLTDYLLIVLFCLVILTTVVSARETCDLRYRFPTWPARVRSPFRRARLSAHPVRREAVESERSSVALGLITAPGQIKICALKKNNILTVEKKKKNVKPKRCLHIKRCAMCRFLR